MSNGEAVTGLIPTVLAVGITKKAIDWFIDDKKKGKSKKFSKSKGSSNWKLSKML